VKRVKRDRHKMGGSGRGRVKEVDCAGKFEDILPRGKADITLINNACLRPDDKSKARELAQVSQLGIWVSGKFLFRSPATR